MLPAHKRKCLGIRGIRNVHAIPGQQEVHSVHGRDGDVRTVRCSLARDLPGRQNGGRLQLSRKMTAGDYVLQVIVTDNLAKDSKYRAAAQWQTFEVEAPQ